MRINWNNQFCKELDKLHMNILSASHCKLTPAWHSANACASFTRIYYVLDGCGEVHYRDQVIPLTAGNIYILPANLEFSYRCDHYLEKLFFHTTLTRDDGYDLFSRVKQCIVLSGQEQTIRELWEMWESPQDLSRVLYIKSHVMGTLCQGLMQCGVKLGEGNEYSAIVQQAIAYIEANLHAALTANRIAEQLYISTSTLQKRFRRETGIPLGRYISDMVMAAAERQLRNTDLSIKTISTELGFCDQFFFSRTFTNR